jgi:RNA polymerase sigma-70 factor (ECF subfamily)
MKLTYKNSTTDNDNKRAFSQLFDTYYKRLCYYADSYIFNFEQSRDIVQEVFTKLWCGIDNINNIANIESFLFKSVKNSCINYIKSINVRDSYKLTVLQRLDSEIYEDKQNEISELTEIISKTIKSQSQTSQEIFSLSKDSNKKHKEIAMLLGISPKTVEWNIAKVRNALKKNLEKYFSI